MIRELFAGKGPDTKKEKETLGKVRDTFNTLYPQSDSVDADERSAAAADRQAKWSRVGSALSAKFGSGVTEISDPESFITSTIEDTPERTS